MRASPPLLLFVAGAGRAPVVAKGRRRRITATNGRSPMTVRALHSATAASEPSPTPDQFRFLPLTDIDESATNPRATCSADALNELAASIRCRGVLQPILERRSV